MTGRYLTEMADVLRAAGCNVIEQDGWRTRSRSSGGYADPNGPLCVMWHHTASSGSASNQAHYMSYSADARPVANVSIAPNGDVWVLAAGATNTNGKGNAMQFSRGTVPADGMNTRALGVEIMNNGVGQSYPQAQVDAMFKVSNAINQLCRNQPSDVGTHSVYAPGRKIDPAKAAVVEGPWRPSGFNGATDSWVMGDIVNECQRRQGTPQPPTPDPDPQPNPEVTDMASTVLILDDARDPFPRYRCGPESKSWVVDGNASAQLETRLQESKGGTCVAVDGFVYSYMKHGGDDVIASYGPIVGPLPPSRDEFGRAT